MQKHVAGLIDSMGGNVAVQQTSRFLIKNFPQIVGGKMNQISEKLNGKILLRMGFDIGNYRIDIFCSVIQGHGVEWQCINPFQ